MSSKTFIRWLQTANVNFVAITYGMIFAVYGATLVDVAEIYGESIETTSTCLTARGLGSVVSSVLGSLVYKLVNTQIVLIGCVTFGLISALLTTLLPSLLYLQLLTFFVGCTMGLIEIGTHVWVQVLWKDKSGPFFHFMNFMFGFGGCLGPFICEPYLRQLTNNSTSGTGNGHLVDINTNVSHAVDSAISPKVETRIFTAFLIMAAILALNAISMIVSYALDRRDFKQSKTASYFAEDLPVTYRRAVLALLAIYMTVGVTCELSFSTFVVAFAIGHTSLRFTKSQAAYLTSFFWFCYTFSRIVTTGLSMKFSPTKLIIAFHFIYISGTVGMILFLDTSPTLVAWLGTGVIGFGLSPYWANGTSWAVNYIQLTPSAMSVIMVLVSSGVMLIPFFVGNQISEKPWMFLYSNLGLAVLLSVIATLLIIFANSKTLRKHKIESETLKVSF